jgi:hypothetical protein
MGKSTELLKHLAGQEYFKKAINWGVGDRRMKDREVALRYIAFRWFDYKNEYTGDMSDFIESAMKRINNFDDTKIQKIKDDFKYVMQMSFSIWGNKNFRIPTNHTKGLINTAILETVCNYISSKSESYIQVHKDVIMQSYALLINDPVYFDAVTQSTGNKAKVLDRFRIVFEIFDKGINR